MSSVEVSPVNKLTTVLFQGFPDDTTAKSLTENYDRGMCAEVAGTDTSGRLKKYAVSMDRNGNIRNLCLLFWKRDSDTWERLVEVDYLIHPHRRSVSNEIQTVKIHTSDSDHVPVTLCYRYQDNKSTGASSNGNKTGRYNDVIRQLTRQEFSNIDAKRIALSFVRNFNNGSFETPEIVQLDPQPVNP